MRSIPKRRVGYFLGFILAATLVANPTTVLSAPAKATSRLEKTALPQSGEGDIRTLLAEQVKAWNSKDLDSFMKGYWNSSALTFFSAGDMAAGWQGAMDRYRRKYQEGGRTMGSLTFSDLRIEILGPGVAFVRGGWHLAMPDGSSPEGLFTLVLKELPEGWRIVHDHTSSAE